MLDEHQWVTAVAGSAGTAARIGRWFAQRQPFGKIFGARACSRGL